jgi:hypothetical protein
MLMGSRIEDASMLKTESFMESIPATKTESSVRYEDIKFLKDRFNQMLENVKNVANKQDELSFRISNANVTSILDSSQLLKEERPICLDQKPFGRVNCVNNIESLQTSLMNINDEIKDNNNLLFSDKSFESQEDVFNITTPRKDNHNNNTVTRLNNIREKLIRETEFNNSYNNSDNFAVGLENNTKNLIDISNNKKLSNNENQYKNILGRIREKSKEVPISRNDYRLNNNNIINKSDNSDEEENINKNLINITKINRHNLNSLTNKLIKKKEPSADYLNRLDSRDLLFTQSTINNNQSINQQINSFSDLKLSRNNNFEIKKSENNEINTRKYENNKVKIDKEEDENDLIISLLNSGSDWKTKKAHPNNAISLKNTNYIEDSYIDHIDDNILDIIDEMENRHSNIKQNNNPKKTEHIKLNYEIDKQYVN